MRSEQASLELIAACLALPLVERELDDLRAPATANAAARARLAARAEPLADRRSELLEVVLGRVPR